MARAQPAASMPHLPRRLVGLARLLSRSYGRPTRRRSDPLDSLMCTVLSQNTSEGNSSRAFQSLKQAFPEWYEEAWVCTLVVLDSAGEDSCAAWVRGVRRDSASIFQNLDNLK